MGLVDALGWAGSAPLIYSVLQSRMLRLRVLNLAASAALVVFNAIIGVWPMVAMNVALCLINAWFIVTLVRRRNRGVAFEWVAAAPDDPFVTRFLAHHGEDAAGFFPAAHHLPTTPGTLAALVLHGDVTVGLVVAGPGGASEPDGTWNLAVDYVIPGYLDYTAGRLIYSAAGPFAHVGARRVVAGPGLVTVHGYFEKAGFTAAGGAWVRELAPTAPATGDIRTT